MMNKIITMCGLYLALMLLIPHLAAAVVIQGVESNQDKYANGDLIIITLYANAKNLEITPNFAPLDSNFRKEMVLVESPQDFSYKVYYPITYSNTKGDGTYNIIISVYNKATDTSSVISYAITLDNDLILNRTSSSENIRLKVREPGSGDFDIPQVVLPGGNTQVSVKNGMVMVCDSTGCTTLTKEEYDKARQYIISDGTVQLSGLTYDQLKSEIQSDVISGVNSELQGYINQVIQINKDLTKSMKEVQELMSSAQEQFMNNTNQTQRMINRGIATNIVSVILVIFLISGAFYIFYLKTSTTWLS